MQRVSRSSTGSVLTVAVLTITVCALVIGVFYKTLIPKYRSVHQGVNWRDAIEGAESGTDYALTLLNEFTTTTPDADSYDWAAAGWVFTDQGNLLNGERKLPENALPALGGEGAVTVTQIAVDVYTRTNTPPHHPWFRIRSTARANISSRMTAADKRDGALRRMKLAATKNGSADPHVTRTIEVLAKPRFRFENAISTLSDLSLGNSKNWGVDSFDSSDPNKSDPGTVAGGVYPSSPSKRQDNGGVASMKAAPANNPYTPLIEGNGATVAGDVRTNGGDNPATTTHENVSGSGGMDQNRIFDDFDQEFAPMAKPNWPTSTISLTPAGKTNFTTGTKASPKRYVVSGGLGAFGVVAPAGSTTGYVEIVVNGALDIGNGNGAKVVIPPNVQARLYVDGNIDFGNGLVNADSASSRVASRLMVYGVSTATNATYTASGNAEQILAFYGPNYAITLNGTVTTVGSMVGKTFNINGGGNGGFHYDEALGRGGDISGWEAASYFEDSRTEL